ncbi:MAG: formate C-acetyltransferase/glycerol dehydratase family glycyl radical enzyme, partial [Gemmatimonadetes bacterium]|nr:formate C-acetyltransferase/glycerol dehydratase family glycyl radical enzyme [Gemmatimonadota bacterium]
MSERVIRLREESLSARAHVSSERAELVTEFYRQEHGSLSTPVKRAMAFKHLMEKKQVFIGEGELIVGERGPAPKATPTYPEVCCHTLEDLDVLNSRDKVSFAVADEVRETYQDRIIPFWRGNTQRELIFQEMTDEWKAAYEAGLYTEFMEQRAPGHTVLDDK